MLKICLALAALILCWPPEEAAAQCNGLFQNNQFCGNTSGAASNPYAISVSIRNLPATAYYVDCTAVVNGNGAQATPWNNLQSSANFITNSVDLGSGNALVHVVNGGTCTTAVGNTLSVFRSAPSGNIISITYNFDSCTTVSATGAGANGGYAIFVSYWASVEVQGCVILNSTAQDAVRVANFGYLVLGGSTVPGDTITFSGAGGAHMFCGNLGKLGMAASVVHITGNATSVLTVNQCLFDAITTVSFDAPNLTFSQAVFQSLNSGILLGAGASQSGAATFIGANVGTVHGLRFLADAAVIEQIPNVPPDSYFPGDVAGLVLNAGNINVGSSSGATQTPGSITGLGSATAFTEAATGGGGWFGNGTYNDKSGSIGTNGLAVGSGATLPTAGIRILATPPTTSAGQSAIGSNVTNGLWLIGNGTGGTNDFRLDSTAGSTCTIAAGTTILNCVAIQISGTSVVPNSRNINTTAPLAGGGNLSADRTLSLNIDSNFAVVTNNLALASIASGNLLANNTAGSAEPTSSTLTALIDRALGSTRGSIIERGASVWGLITPGTSGLPFVSAGAGADPAYSLLGIAGGGTNCSSASGTCLDNISGFSSTGILVRTAAGTYAFRSLGSGTNITVTNPDGVAGAPSIATINNPLFSTSVTSPIIYGGSAAGSTLTLQSTSSGSPSGDAIAFNVHGTVQAQMVNGAFGLQTANPKTYLDVNLGTANNIAVATSLARFQAADAAIGGSEWITYGSAGNILAGGVAEGTSASPTILVATARSMFQLGGYGYDGGFQRQARMVIQNANNGAAAAWTAGTSRPTEVFFETTPNSSITPAESLRLHASGGVSIGAATAVVAIGELSLPKVTASASAPGAANAKITVVCGTNAGTAKWITYAGTSTTPVTIVDNVGSGVTGC